MAKRNIVKVGDPILRKTCKPVELFDDRLHVLLDDMKETLDYVEGLGLAAPQVGILKRVCIIEYDDAYYELVNPVITHQEGKVVDTEGCLSVPGYHGLVERAEIIDVKYYDRFGKSHKIHADGYFARVFMHEIDHLDGVLFSDKMIEKIVDEEK